MTEEKKYILKKILDLENTLGGGHKVSAPLVFVFSLSELKSGSEVDGVSSARHFLFRFTDEFLHNILSYPAAAFWERSVEQSLIYL